MIISKYRYTDARSIRSINYRHFINYDSSSLFKIYPQICGQRELKEGALKVFRQVLNSNCPQIFPLRILENFEYSCLNSNVSRMFGFPDEGFRLSSLYFRQGCPPSGNVVMEITRPPSKRFGTTWTTPSVCFAKKLSYSSYSSWKQETCTVNERLPGKLDR